jgi:hypothetical protein
MRQNGRLRGQIDRSIGGWSVLQRLIMVVLLARALAPASLAWVFAAEARGNQPGSSVCRPAVLALRLGWLD